MMTVPLMFDFRSCAKHNDSTLEFSEVLKLPRIALLILAGSSICERQFSAHNPMHTAGRSSLNATTIRSAFAINSYGPQFSGDFKPEEICTLRMGLVASDKDGPTITCPRRRGLVAMIRKVMADAQTRYVEPGSLPQPLV